MDPTLFDYLASSFDERKTVPILATASPLAGNTRESTPSSSHKKKFRYGARDSLNSRMKIGRPGSRRYRHWENEFFLLKNLSETESECESDDWDESYAPSYGAFAMVFEEGNREIWEPFVDTTEEQQRILLAEYESDDSFEETFHAVSPPEAFALLRKRSQRTLKRHKKSRLLEQMDGVIFAFMNGHLYDDQLDFLRQDDSGETLIFSFSEKFHRHMLHALCEFYDLVSYSVDITEERVTVVHPRRNISRSSSLLQLLNTF